MFEFAMLIGYFVLFYLAICLILLPLFICDHRRVKMGWPIALLIAGLISSAFPFFWFVAVLVAALSTRWINPKPEAVS